MTDLTDWLLRSWSAFLTANPFATFISAALGAFAGALATSRREAKRAVIAEINSINAARALSFSICSAYISQKRQQVTAIETEFGESRIRFVAARAAANAAAAPGHPAVVDFKPQFLQFTSIKVPIETLERQVLDKTSASARALAATAQLIGVIDCFEKAVEERDRLIVELRKVTGLDQALLYYGLRGATGVDERYKNNIDALSHYIDDCIFFSKLLGGDLLTYGRKLRRRNSWRYWSLPFIDRENWNEALDAGLIPPDEQYKDWLKGFKPAPSRFRRLVRWINGETDD